MTTPAIPAEEREINLLLALRNTAEGLTAAEIIKRVSGYNPAGGGSARRMFERDKDILRQIGVPLRASGTGDQCRYRIEDSQPRTGEAPVTGEGATRANPVVEDLAGALEAVEEHLDEVTRQRDMLAGLLERARGGATVSPMTPRMAAFFDRMERAAPDGATRATVRNDRDLVDLACYRGQMPPEAEVFFNDPHPRFDAESLALYAQDPAELSDEEVERRARTTVGNLEAQLDPERLRDLARSVDVDAVRSIFRLTAALEYFDIRLARALEREFLATIERWREG